MIKRTVLLTLGILSLLATLQTSRIDIEPKLPSLPEEAVVTVVYDGDTIKVRYGNRREIKVRLLGVDALELSDSREDVQLRAQMSKRFSFIHLYKEKIKLTYDWQTKDKYGRLLAYVWTKDLGLFNKYIISKGFATTFRRFPFKYMDSFVKEENRARRKREGFWNEGPPPDIPQRLVGRHEGRIITVRFDCTDTDSSSGFYFLKGKLISCLIPLKYLNRFSNPGRYDGQALEIYGLVEKYRGDPQILVYFPTQIKVLKRREFPLLIPLIEL